MLRKALNSQEKTSPGIQRRCHMQNYVGCESRRHGEYVEAEPLLITGYQGFVQRQNSILAENQLALDQIRE
jgi:hypothetical protein